MNKSKTSYTTLLTYTSRFWAQGHQRSCQGWDGKWTCRGY